MAEAAAKLDGTNPAVHGALALALYRAGRFEDARRSARESIAAYGRKWRASPLFNMAYPANPVFASTADAVTPEGPAGTPREWLLLAMIEAKLGHKAEAVAWRDKVFPWLDRASADPVDPSLVGAMLDPTARTMSQVQVNFQGGILRMTHSRRNDPTWRQLAELSILRQEAEPLLAK
jgi:hypothetical protein